MRLRSARDWPVSQSSKSTLLARSVPLSAMTIAALPNASTSSRAHRPMADSLLADLWPKSGYLANDGFQEAEKLR